jgi:HEAT repeat protein
VSGLLGVSTLERQRVVDAEVLFERGDALGLVERLSDPSWVVRRAVVSALARLGDSATQPLRDLLVHHRENEASVAAAVDALVASLGEADQVALVLARDRNPAVACDGAQILGRRRVAGAIPELSQLVHSDNDNVALAALEAVGRIGGQPAVDLLIEAVESRSFFRAFPAIDLLGRTGDPRAVRPLTALLRNPQYATEAARALGRTGQPAAVGPLAGLLTKPNDADVRIGALALAEIDDRYADRFGARRVVDDALRAIDAEAASRRLTQAVADADSSERSALCRVLGWLGGRSAVAGLVALLDGEPEGVQAAATALAGLGLDAEPALLQALRESGGERRLLLLPIVGRRNTATADIIVCLDDPNPNVRALACDALGRIADAKAVPLLFLRLTDPDARVSQAAVAAIQAIGGEEVERLAVGAARSPDARIRRPALRILAYFGSPSTLDLFLEAMGDPDDRVRDVAANGLAAIDDARAVDGLLLAANHASPRTRATAIRGLGQTETGPGVRERLRQALSDPDAWVRYYAVQALSRRGDHASAETIASLLLDPAGHVRVAVIDALARLRGDQSLDALHDAVESGDLDVARAALVGIGIVRNRASLPRVLRAVREGDSATRLVALSALAEYDTPEIVPALSAAASDPDDSVRAAAVTLLGVRPGPDATRALVDLLDHTSTRERAVAALARAADGRIEGILASLGVSGVAKAPMLVAALARIGTADAQVAIEAAFAFDNVHARRAVASALAAGVTPRAHALLERAAQVDEDVHVRRICAAVLRG